MKLKDVYKWILVLPALALLVFIFSYVSGTGKTVDEYEKIVIRAPVDFDVVDCDTNYCKDWIEIQSRGVTLKFYQSNPFYTEFERVISSKGFLMIWYDSEERDQIYQVSLNRKVVIPFEKLHSINNFDNSIVLIFPLILLFVGLGRVLR